MRARYVTLACCLAAVTVGSAAFAGTGFGKDDKEQTSAMTVLAMADAAPGPDHGPRGEPDRAGPPPRGPHGCHGRPPLARILSEQETAIGIRANQLDAWRDFSDAMQAMMAPPARPPAEALGAKEAFAFPKAMADEVEKRAEAARKVEAAIEKLKTTLTPEQLERAARFAPPPPPFGPRPHGGEMGPGPDKPR